MAIRERVADQGQEDVETLYQSIRSGGAKLAGPSGESSRLPDSLQAFLCALDEALNKGKCVYIQKNQASLTTAEAAGILGVSRQFLINLLSSDKLPHHMVGTHRRIYVHDLMKYKAERNGHRKKILRDLVNAEIQEGLYDKVPPAESPKDPAASLTLPSARR
jgi:excisionase family DNA binding protein